MNVVFIITDTVCKYMVGAYGQPIYDTPNIDRLAADGIRFERAYTASPVCTPARGAIFTGQQPATNGAWQNDQAPHRHLPMLGDVLRQQNIRAPYTGKWHLDGSQYNGRGTPDGGFEPDWWLDRINFLNSLPDEIRQLQRMATTVDDLKAADFQPEHVFGHCAANRAIDFLEQAGDEPFVLTVSLDEPHDPWLAPPAYWEKFTPADLPARPNYCAPLDDKPMLQQRHAAFITEEHGNLAWEELAAKRLKFFGCNSYIDREVGRIVDAIDKQHADNTVVIYTSDHGDQLGSHGLHDKGPFMYEETTNVPFIVRMPGGPRGAVSHSLVSQIDLMPTFLDLAGGEIPDHLHGRSLRPVFEDANATVRDTAMISFNRFMAARQGSGGFWPIRAMTDGRHKLVVNLFDTDELYDLEADPYEMTNLITNPYHAPTRDRLHDALLAEMERTHDPMWNAHWHDRPWRQPVHHYNGPR